MRKYLFRSCENNYGLLTNPNVSYVLLILGFLIATLALFVHSRALTNTKKEIVAFQRVDKALWDSMKTLTYEQLKPVLSPWIGDGEIKAIITRRDNLQKKIDEMIKKTSAPAVLMR